jgi:choline dehydrogenase-like flavoprotein
LPIALQAGAILVAGTPVTRILTDAIGDYATGVEYATATGEKKQLMADLVVMAAFTIQNPRLLLASASDRHPNGLANSSGTVGKYIMAHPAALVYGLFEEQTQCYLGAFGGQLVNQDSYAKDTHAASGAFGSYQWMIGQAVKPNDLLGIATTRPDLFGNDLHDFMKHSAQDAHGVPLARVTHTTHAKSKALWVAALEEGKAVFEAAGATDVWVGPQAGMHIMGGTVMGEDPQSSVTNSYGQCHDISNLVVAGAGLFPGSAGVNPTFTIYALTARSGDHLLANWPRTATGSRLKPLLQIVAQKTADLRLAFRPPRSLVEITKLLFQFARLGIASPKFRAILEDDQLPIDLMPAVARGRAGNRDDVPGFQLLVCPAASSQDG